MTRAENGNWKIETGKFPSLLRRGYRGGREFPSLPRRGYRGGPELPSLLRRGCRGGREFPSLPRRGPRGGSEFPSLLRRGLRGGALVLLFTLTLLAARPASAQVATGLPPYGSFSGGPFDVVDN
jgi:hypothetical protein